MGGHIDTLLPLTIALAIRGATDEADTALEKLEKHRHPSYGLLEYERALAHAWVKACHGERSEAIALAMSAAENARAAGQLAAEVVCLQTATQFGESSTAMRLQELAAIVEGPRVAAAARFATGLRHADGTALDSASSRVRGNAATSPPPSTLPRTKRWSIDAKACAGPRNPARLARKPSPGTVEHA